MKEKQEDIRRLLENMRAIDYVRPDELPNIDLYMDQVTTFMDRHLESSKRYTEDKLLTKTMINNYTKNNLLPSPNKKKYTQDHMYLLIFIYYLKNILSISDIQQILTPLTEQFFGDNGSIELAKIYEEVFRQGQATSKVAAREIIRGYNKAMKSFEGVEDQKEAEFLHTFSFISMLCFDVSMKSYLIKKIIDETFTAQKQPKAAKKKASETTPDEM